MQNAQREAKLPMTSDIAALGHVLKHAKPSIQVYFCHFHHNARKLVEPAQAGQINEFSFKKACKVYLVHLSRHIFDEKHRDEKHTYRVQNGASLARTYNRHEKRMHYFGTTRVDPKTNQQQVASHFLKSKDVKVKKDLSATFPISVNFNVEN